MMSLLDVFMAAQSSKDGGKGGSVLRQASRRLADKNDPNSASTTQSASMSRLSVNMKPPHSSGGSAAPSHEPSPQPPGSASNNGSHVPAAPTTYSVRIKAIISLCYAAVLGSI